MAQSDEVDVRTQEIVAAFEACTLPELNHEDHVRVTWSYCRQDELANVLSTLPDRLRRYAASKGVPDYYHETITFAFTCLIHERTSRGRSDTWTAFREANPDLFRSSFLEHYYPREVLDSDRARRVFLFPAPAAKG